MKSAKGPTSVDHETATEGTEVTVIVTESERGIGTGAEAVTMTNTRSPAAQDATAETETGIAPINMTTAGTTQKITLNTAPQRKLDPEEDGMTAAETTIPRRRLPEEDQKCLKNPEDPAETATGIEEKEKGRGKKKGTCSLFPFQMDGTRLLIPIPQEWVALTRIVMTVLIVMISMRTISMKRNPFMRMAMARGSTILTKMITGIEGIRLYQMTTQCRCSRLERGQHSQGMKKQEQKIQGKVLLGRLISAAIRILRSQLLNMAEAILRTRHHRHHHHIERQLWTIVNSFQHKNRLIFKSLRWFGKSLSGTTNLYQIGIRRTTRPACGRVFRRSSQRLGSFHRMLQGQRTLVH